MHYCKDSLTFFPVKLLYLADILLMLLRYISYSFCLSCVNRGFKVLFLLFQVDPFVSTCFVKNIGKRLSHSIVLLILFLIECRKVVKEKVRNTILSLRKHFVNYQLLSKDESVNVEVKLIFFPVKLLYLADILSFTQTLLYTYRQLFIFIEAVTHVVA